MATIDPNPVVANEWEVFVEAGLEFTLSLLHEIDIEWRVTVTGAAIEGDIRGHQLMPSEGLNRSLSGPGYVQLRMVASQCGNGIPVALTTWTP